jgi:hypothetical protein
MATTTRSRKVPQDQWYPYLTVFSVGKTPVPGDSYVLMGKRFGNQNEVYDKGKNLGKLIEEPTIVQIAQKHEKTGAQVALGEYIYCIAGFKLARGVL